MRQFEDDEITIDLRDVWHSVLKNMRFIRNVTIGVTALSVAYALLAPPTYESNSLIRVKQQKGISSSLLDAIPMGNSMANQQMLNTYQNILKSRSVVKPVIEKFEGASGKLPDYAAYVQSTIITSPVKDTELVQVAVRGKTPEEAQAKNQALLESFLTRLTEIEREQSKITRSFLEERVSASKKDLADAEAAMNKFQKEHKVLSPDAEVKMAADKLALTDRMRAENKVAVATGSAKASANASSLQRNAKKIADNSVIKAYNAQLTKLEGERIAMASKYTQKHPAMIKINQDIAELEQQLDLAIQEVANGQASSDNPVMNGLLAEQLRGEAEAQVAASNLEALDRVEAEFKNDIEKLSDNQRQYLGLLREFNVAQEIYIMLAKRVEEAKVAEVSITRDVQIVDNAILPDKPIAPQKRKIVMIAFLMSLLGSSGWVILRDLMNRTVKSSEDVEKYLGLPVLGQIPSVESLKEAQEVAEMGTMKKIWRALWK